MSKDYLRRGLQFAGILAALWLALKYLLPILLPFLIGTLIAFAAEPVVRVGVNRLKLHRTLSAAIGVTLTLVLLAGMLSLIGAFLVRELALVAGAVPDVGAAVQNGLIVLEDWLIGLADKTPEGVRPALQRAVLDTFDGSSALVGQLTGKIPGALASAVGWLSEGAVTLGTGVIAGFMISVRLPRLKAWVKSKLPAKWHGKYLPALKSMKSTIGAWFRAQIKLMIVTWGILSLGFLLLRIPFGFLWAAGIALVDAVPVLGTGTILLPWALIEVLQGRYFQGIGLVAVFGATWLSRTILEPRLVGHHLGLDPLVTLAAFYIGFQIWGIPGMIVAPLLTAVIKGAMGHPVQK